METRSNFLPPEAAPEGLDPGAKVVARDGHGTHLHGRVDEASAGLGVVWVRDDAIGERRLFLLEEVEQDA
ncbi:hypothetical protein GCM10023081_01840 [Arthrobacter ginkgonis]|uniref:Uncharacterized protein n=1 Tax=Arthrobacter ginkgonis TaxID=1630594 RepID=A0ABP7BRB0_9MICC